MTTWTYFVITRKADKNGKVLRNINIPLHEFGVQSAEEVEDINSLKYIGSSGNFKSEPSCSGPEIFEVVLASS